MKASHFDDGKLQLHWLLSMPGLDEVAKVGEYGAKKYGQNNYANGAEYMRYLGSCVRHLAKFIRGQDNDVCDPECSNPCKHHSGLSHLAHCAYNCLIILCWMKSGKGKDDRFKVLS